MRGGGTGQFFIEIVESLLTLIYIERKNNPAVILPGQRTYKALLFISLDILHSIRMAILKSHVFSIMICYNEYLP